VAEPPKIKIGVAEASARARDLPSHLCSPIIYDIWQVNLQGCKLSRRVRGAHYDDLLNIKNNWMKNIVWRAGFFAYFICLQKKSKSHRRDAVRNLPCGRRAGGQ
jgi:hypothetical protein